MDKYDIFISYSRKDLERVKAIKVEIERTTNATCWMDLNGIESGVPRFTQSIIDGIEHSQVFLFMRSEQSQQSKFALLELNYASEEHGKHVVIVNIDDSQMTKEFRFLYSLTDTINWDNQPQREKLLRDIRRWIGNADGNNGRETDAKARLCAMFEKDMVYVEGGTFAMCANREPGSAHSSELLAHRVTLSPFYICKHQVTQEEWETVMGSNPSFWKGKRLPVESVSWNDCQTFINKLNSLTGKHFRLPTEAEWEYAARGGNRSQGYKYSGSDTLDNVAWCCDNSDGKTHEVMTKSPNELGLYDMSGNVCEWCSDWYDRNYYANSPSKNPKGPSSGSFRVARGGSWFILAMLCHVDCRYFYSPSGTTDYCGLRLAL